MENEIENKINFRLSQSREKLELAAIMLEKGMYNDSVLCSYLSMFYSVRVLLIQNGSDSDDHDRILELVESYYEPAGWTGVDIIGILREAKTCRDSVESVRDAVATREEAENFYTNAKMLHATIAENFSA